MRRLADAAERLIPPAWRARAAIVLVVILSLSVVVLADRLLGTRRIDATEGGLYTLSAATRSYLETVTEPITLRLFYSPALADADPRIGPYARRVDDVLRRFVALSRGAIRVERFDPEPFSPEEDRALGYGLTGVPLDAAGTRGYFGLAGVNGTDERAVVPLFEPQREPFLEYELMRVVTELAQPDKPVLGLLTGLPLPGDPRLGGDAWMIYRELSRLFDVRLVDPTVGTLDPDIEILMVVQPGPVSARLAYAIDQYVVAGRPLLALLDPYAESDLPSAAQRPGDGMPIEHGLDALLDGWGVTMTEGAVVGDRRLAQEVTVRRDGRPMRTSYLPWLALTGRTLARDQAVTGLLSRVAVASAGALGVTDAAAQAGLALVPLMTTTADSTLIPVDDLRPTPDPVGLLQTFRAEGGPFVLAARLEGPVASGFPEGPPPGVEALQGGHRARSDGPVNVFLVADSDVLLDELWLDTDALMRTGTAVPTANNADFLVNLLDALAGGHVLVGLGGRPVGQHPFVEIERRRRDAELEFRAAERRLTETLKQLEARLAAPDKGALPTPERQEETADARRRLLETRAELREVQLGLNRGIDSLEARIRGLAIWSMPAALLVVMAALGGWRRWRRRRRE